MHLIYPNGVCTACVRTRYYGLSLYMYGLETLALSELHQHKLQVCENKENSRSNATLTQWRISLRM